MQQIKAAIACLIEIKAIYPKAQYPLTALGYHLAKMPVDVRIGKMLIYASLLEVSLVQNKYTCKIGFDIVLIYVCYSVSNLF